MERFENRRQKVPGRGTGTGTGTYEGGGVSPAGHDGGAMFNPAFNFARGHAWTPRTGGGYPFDLDAGVRITRLAKYPLSELPFPNPATFPDGNGIGAMRTVFMPMMDAYAISISFAKSPYGPGVNSIPANSNFYAMSMMTFPSLMKTGG